MNLNLRVAAVVVVVSAAAFASSMALWPPTPGFAPPPSLMPFFVGLGVAESLAFGLGVAFLIFGWRLVRETGVGSFAAWGGYLGMAWSLVNWGCDDGFHRGTGVEIRGLSR